MRKNSSSSKNAWLRRGKSALRSGRSSVKRTDERPSITKKRRKLKESVRSSLKKNGKSANAWNRSKERRKSVNTRSVCASWRNRKESSVPDNKKLRSASGVRRRRGGHQKKNQTRNGLSGKKVAGGNEVRESQSGDVLFLTGTGVRKDEKAVRNLIGKTVTYPSEEVEKVLVVVLQMKKDSAEAVMTIEVHVEEVMMSVHPDGALMMTAGPGEALMMTEVNGEAMTTVGQGVGWMMTGGQGAQSTMTAAPDEAMTTVAREEDLMMIAGPVEAWMNLEALVVVQMMTGAPEEGEMMRGGAAGVWMTPARVVEKTLDPGNLLEDQVQVDGESERRHGRKAGDLLVILAMMMMVASVMEMTSGKENDLENAALLGKRAVPGGEVVAEVVVEKNKAAGETLVVKTLTARIVVNGVT